MGYMKKLSERLHSTAMVTGVVSPVPRTALPSCLANFSMKPLLGGGGGGGGGGGCIYSRWDSTPNTR